VIFEIEIYSKDKELKAKQEITKELSKLVNDIFDEHYGFSRKSNIPIPNIDLDVDRRYMKYQAKIDENKRIYRR